MQLAELIEIVAWSLWFLIGVVAGLVAASYTGGRQMLAADIFVGIISSITGGWLYTLMVGNQTKAQLIVSVLCATILCIISVWILNWVNRNKY